MPTADLTSGFALNFQSYVRAALDQTQSKTMPYVRMETPSNNAGFRPEVVIASAEDAVRSTKYQPIEANELALTSRWMVPTTYAMALHSDTIDKLRSNIQLEGHHTQQMVKAYNRRCDTLVGEALLGAARTGQNGGGPPAAFDAANMTVAHNSEGFTVAKLRAARTMLIKNHVDLDTETPCVAITEQGFESLLADVHYISKDFNISTPLVDGSLSRYMGFNIIIFSSEFWNLESAGGHAQHPFWVQSGVCLAKWPMAIPPRIDRRTDWQGLPFQTYMEYTLDAQRLDEKKVGVIEADYS